MSQSSGERRDNIAAIIGAAFLTNAYTATKYPDWEKVISQTVAFTDRLIVQLDATALAATVTVPGTTTGTCRACKLTYDTARYAIDCPHERL